MVIGIDIGSTTTKSVAIYPDQSLRMLTTKAFDAVTSATGALGKMLMDNNLDISCIKHIVLTGVGAQNVAGNLFGIPTTRIGEIQAVGLGGMYLSGRKHVIISNIGTGTALVEARNNDISHVGGTGVGGGTLLGLAKAILNISDINLLFELADKGTIHNIDLLIGDLVDTNIGFLKPEMTAANFGKMLDTATEADKALGIIHMVYQVIGIVSVFVARSRNLGTVVVTGTASNLALGKETLNTIGDMYQISFLYPDQAEYATAIGAALSVNREMASEA